jgi:prepilin-type N-terminal cleavage/methylation domain-containing protein/prepilin-type processing-associated H-X9-DG protein
MGCFGWCNRLLPENLIVQGVHMNRSAYRCTAKQSRRAFTLVELLVVIGIIAVLIGVLLPALSSARRQAASLKCLSQLREIGLAFKLYANDSKDFFPVARQDYPDKGGSAVSDTLPGPANYYWSDEVLKYVSKAGTRIQDSATGGTNGSIGETQKSVLWGCPAWVGRGNFYNSTGTSLYVNGVYIYENGYAMNIYPSYKPNYPKTGTGLMSGGSRELAQRSETVWGSGNQGKRYKSSQYTMSAQRMLLTESTMWLLRFTPCTTVDQIQAQPAIGLDVSGPGGMTVDRYRHGKYPILQGSYLAKSGGKVSYNILYCDGHASTSTDILDAYRAIRMRDPG